MVSACLIAAPSTAEFNRTSSLIDIPIAYILPSRAVKVSFNGSFTGGQDAYPKDADFTIAAGLGRAEIAVTCLTLVDYSLDVAFQVLGERDEVPAIALGVQNLFTAKHISEVGTGVDMAWEDERYFQRTTEQLSAFGVASKDLGVWGTFHAGVGRGRFVGYGPRSKLLNTDTFSDRRHNDAFGIFGGWKSGFFSSFSMIVESDGRDLNLGLSRWQPYYQLSVAVTKIEHRVGSSASPDLYPRFAFGASVNILSFAATEPDTGKAKLVGVVKGVRTGEPLSGLLSFPGTEMPPVQCDPKGRFSLALNPGTYLVRCAVSGYGIAQKRVKIVQNKTYMCNFSLKKLPRKAGAVEFVVLFDESDSPDIVMIESIAFYIVRSVAKTKRKFRAPLIVGFSEDPSIAEGRAVKVRDLLEKALGGSAKATTSYLEEHPVCSTKLSNERKAVVTFPAR